MPVRGRPPVTALDDRFNDLVARLNAIVWEADGEEYKMIFVSDRCRDLLGYDPQQWLTEPEFWERHLHPDDRESTIEQCDNAIREGRPVELEYRFRAATGEYRWISDVIGIAGEVGRNRRLVGVMIDITDRKTLESQLAHLAFHDQLTGLPNRAELQRRLEARLARPADAVGLLAVLFIDLDDFKTINDSLGHAAGDELLVKAADRLRAETRGTDFVARLGGDEFVVVTEVAERGEAIALADRLIATIGRPSRIRRRTVATRASIGIVFDDAARSVDTLLRDADVAMYRAKEAGKGRVVAFDPSMHLEAVARLDVESELRSALRLGELELAYQPIIDLTTGRMRSLEGLARWPRPGRSAIPPSTFIPMAEQTGLIWELGLQLLRSGTAQLAAWRGRHPRTAGLRLSLNVSPAQLADPRLVGTVERAIDDAGLTPADIDLELTESAFLLDQARILHTLAGLSRLGVGLLLDDFGTGYSGLSYLTRLPLTGLKIDQSFVASMARSERDVAVLRATIAFAKALRLPVTAEGVENDYQRAALAELGCDAAQGYLFARPLRAEAVEPLLIEGRDDERVSRRGDQAGAAASSTSASPVAMASPASGSTGARHSKRPNRQTSRKPIRA